MNDDERGSGAVSRWGARGGHELERTPHPQQVIIAGRLDTIRHSDPTFVLHLPDGTRIEGLARSEHRDTLPELWGGNVLVSGRAHFTRGGKVQRIEAQDIRSATKGDLETWLAPEPASRSESTAGFRRPQGPRSGLSAILGQWPGDETDEEIAEALEEMS